MACEAHAPPATDSIWWGEVWSARRIRLHDGASWVLGVLNTPLEVDGLVQLAAIRLTSGGEWLAFEAGGFGARLDGFDVRFGWGPVGCLDVERASSRRPQPV